LAKAHLDPFGKLRLVVVFIVWRLVPNKINAMPVAIASHAALRSADPYWDIISCSGS
jgi:hypothetical protein